MSGHSKWSTIKRAKGAADAKRAAIFTKLGRAITVAAKEKGGDPTTNFGLRLAMEKAKAANMPKDNIERAIKRGTGELQGEIIEEIYYEGFGPGGVAIVIKALTDNKNRTSQSIKHIFTKFGGSLGGPNAVMWQFEKKGVIRIANEKLSDQDELELKIIDLGAQDINKLSDSWVILTNVSDLQNVSKGIEDIGMEVEYADLEYVAKEFADVDENIIEKNQKLFEALDDDEDVDDYYTNIKE